MKQHITQEQYEELTDAQQKILLAWTIKHSYGHILTIGQMIEFLDEHYDLSLDKQISFTGDVYLHLKAIIWDKDEEPCDILWAKVKNILEQE
jgi:hypothetical protein